MKLKDEMKNPGVSFMTVDKCKFRKPVIPGDVLDLKVNRLNKVKMFTNLKVSVWSMMLYMLNVFFLL